MKSARGSIGGSVDRPDPAIRFYLFHGSDEGQSRGFADRLLAGFSAAKQALSSSELKSDPAKLADAAQAISLFGERQLIWIEPAGEEIAAAVATLLEAPSVESPAVAIAGRLTRSSELLKIAEAHPLALAHVSYPLEGRDAERAIDDLARVEGLRLQPGVAARLAEAVGNDQRIAARELAKLALYVDASPERPRDLGHEALDAVGAELTGDFLRIADLALAGEMEELSQELARLPSGGGEAIPVLRSVQRRLLMLAPLRARVERGERSHDVVTSAGKAVFWKDKSLVQKLLERWDAAGLARVAERTGEAERQMMLAGAPAAETLGEELIAIARAAARRR